MVLTDNYCHLWNMIITAFILFCLSLPTFHYISSYAYTISKRINIVPIINQDIIGDNTKINAHEDPCSGRYIFMHDLPPRFNLDLVTKCHALSLWFNFCPYVENGGFGPQFNGESWYATNQFMLLMIFHNRMKNYECLTSSSVLASAIYAPFYPGLDIGRFLWGGFNSSVKDSMALDFVKWLREKPEWGRMLGRDHFFVAGRMAWDFGRSSNSKSGSWGNKLLNLPETKNMTMLTIESNPYSYNDFAIPYPTYFHPSNDNEVFEWQERVRRGKRRPYLFAFGGGPRPNMSGSIRQELIRQCKNATYNRCQLLDCFQNHDLCHNPLHIIKIFMQSDFCLQPPGDSYTRRSTFDSILAGCIPVFFHPGSAYIQYLWHFPQNYTKYSVYVSIDEVKNGTVNVEQLLSKISDNDVLAMREEVVRLIPRIIYAKKKLEKIDDAFDVAIKRILKRINDSRRGIREQEKSDYYTKDGKQRWDSFF